MVLVVGLVCSLAGCDQEVSEGSAAPATVQPSPSTRPATTVPTVTPQGFERVQARVTAADGEVCELCVWLADQTELRDQASSGIDTMLNLFYALLGLSIGCARDAKGYARQQRSSASGRSRRPYTC